jgi:hypothetical protein
MNHFTVLINFLSHRTQFLEEINQRIKIEQKLFSLFLCSSVFLAIYGAIIGSFGSWMQMFSSAIKLPALYLLTMVICLPTLFFFDVIAGSPCSFGQYLAWLLSSLSLISVMLLGFAPIALFFLISTYDYNFFLLLNIIIFTITGIIGVNFFYQSMISIPNKSPEASQPFKRRNTVIKAWLFLYAFVGSQLGWTLRPFFGDPNQSFALFRPVESNFYIQVLKIIGRAMGLH